MGIYSNIVKKDKLREIQGQVLEEIRDALVQSYGPYGSNTLIYNDSTLNKYTKDGHEILSGIQILNEIEASVQRDLVQITNNTVRKVGDGTTAATILSSIIFKTFTELEGKYTPYKLMRLFDKTVKEITKNIMERNRVFDFNTAYKIAMISTNGNEKISKEIASIYEKYGNEVYIDVTITTQDRNVVKVYDGLSMSEGLYNSAYMNIPKENKADIRDCHVYYFDDPVDTPEMMSLLNAIIDKNIFQPVKDKSKKIIPTVILTPHISRDMSTYIEQVEAVMTNCKGMDKPPLIIINNIFKTGNVEDIIKMCGCPPIKKYINVEQQKEDIKQGIAPTVKNVERFCGYCDEVVATTKESKFINPKNMVVRDKDGNITGYTDEYKSLLDFLKTELERYKEDGEDAAKIGGMRRRINALKANMIEYVIGGISMADREALKCLVEDAVLNCRSAAEHGVGWGANFEGLIASNKVRKETEDEDIKLIATTIYESYVELITTLYKTMNLSDEKIDSIIKAEEPFNMVTEEYDGNVLSSIMLDPVILDSINRLLTLLFTCNQFIVDDPLKNVYNNPSYTK
jgi:chaperonin GroEL (HSP60 family)